ncbi:MAG: energy transducer TonB, partial [Rubrivivax sp.]
LGVPGVAKLEVAQPAVSLAVVPSARVITLPPPRLLSRIDPEVPQRLQRRGARRTEVMVDMLIGADGAVRDVQLRNVADEELVAAVRDALLQWRYEPQPVERPYTVQLVFGPN